MSKKIVLSCESKKSDYLCASLWDLKGVQGVVESDSPVDEHYLPPEEFEVLEFGSKAAKKWVNYINKHKGNDKAYLHVYVDEAEWEASELQEVLDLYKAHFESESKLEQKDYLKAYKDSVQGSCFGESLWVGPPWAEVPQGKIAFVVEPGLAFGTGDHPTTQLILEWLYENKDIANPKRVYDLGTGSGVLAVAAKKFWPHAEIIVSDTDPQCGVEVEKTFLLNGLDYSSVKGAFGESAQESLIKEIDNSCDMVISNIYAEVLIKLLDQIESSLVEGGYWVASGILEGKSERKLLLDAGSGFQMLERKEMLREHMHLSKESGLESNNETWIMLAMKKR